MSTSTQDKEFSSLMDDQITVSIDSSALEIAIDYIGRHFMPDEVFGRKDLESWAEDNGYIKE